MAPPYPLSPGAHSASEKKAGYKKSIGGGRNESLYDRKTKKNRYQKAAEAAQKDADDLRKHGYNKEADAVQKVADKNREKGERKANKNEGLTDKQKDILKKGALITAGVLGTAGAIYLGNRYLDKKATKILVDRAIADADKYTKDFLKYRDYEKDLLNSAADFKFKDNSTSNFKRTLDMADKMGEMSRSARNDAFDLRAKANSKSFSKEEKKRVIQEALKLRPKNESDFISNDKLMGNLTKSELVDLADQARLKGRYSDFAKLYNMSGNKLKDLSDAHINSTIKGLMTERDTALKAKNSEKASELYKLITKYSAEQSRRRYGY